MERKQGSLKFDFLNQESSNVLPIHIKYDSICEHI